MAAAVLQCLVQPASAFSRFFCVLLVSSLGNPRHQLAGREQSLGWCGSAWLQLCALQGARGRLNGAFLPTRSKSKPLLVTFFSTLIYNQIKPLFSTSELKSEQELASLSPVLCQPSILCPQNAVCLCSSQTWAGCLPSRAACIPSVPSLLVLSLACGM